VRGSVAFGYFLFRARRAGRIDPLDVLTTALRAIKKGLLFKAHEPSDTVARATSLVVL
jgi:hypothetical protein